MSLDLLKYPATKIGAWEMVDALLPRIVELWKAERAQLATDDLVAMIDVRSNQVRVDSRSAICRQLEQRFPTLDLLEHLATRPDAPNGSIRIWVIISFLAGELCCLPFTIAQS